jgi:hypothetical protein
MYSGLVLFAWIIQLPTTTPFLLQYAPVVLLLFIIFHEKTLQRNLITLRAITPAESQPEDWLEAVLSSTLTAINANKSITIAIENKDSLHRFLDTPFIINADITKNILDILLTSTSYDEQKMIWIDTHGKIRGINAYWITKQEKNDALFYSLHSDIIIISAHPFTRTFTLICHGIETKNITAHQVRAMLKKQLSLQSSSQHKGAYRENTTTEKSLSH